MRNPADKIILWDEAEGLAARLHKEGVAIVTTNGCFDLLHLGHFTYLAEARRQGSCLWVGLNSDASVKKLKGPKRPILDERTRALQLAALEAVDYITIFNEQTPEEFLKKVRSQIHAKGGDYKPEDLPEKKVLEKWGGKVVCLALTPGFSTTSLIEKLQTS